MLANYSTRTTRKRRQRHKPIDGRTRLARRIRKLAAGYARRLGDAANDPIVRSDVLRLAETEVIAEDQRAAALRREATADLAELTRLQNAARRLRRALNLDGLPPPPPPMTLEEYARAKYGDPRGE